MHNAGSLSDEELVEQVRSVDQELYAKVVKRYEQALLRYAYGLLRDEQMAADVVQEAFIKAFVNLHGFDTKKKFSSWLYRIVHNEAINVIRKRRHIVFGDNHLEKLVAEGTDMAEDMDKRAVQQAMQKCMDELPFMYREPLWLFFVEEKSYGEIGDVLRMPMGTVATRINRGKKLLKYLWQQKN